MVSTCVPTNITRRVSRLFLLPKTAFCSTFVPLCLFLSEIDRERCCKTGTCFSLCSLEGVGIDVQRGRCLRVAERGRNGAHIGVIGDEQRGIEMSKLMDAVPRQAVTFAKLFSPVIEIAGACRRSVELGKRLGRSRAIGHPAPYAAWIALPVAPSPCRRSTQGVSGSDESVLSLAGL